MSEPTCRCGVAAKPEDVIRYGFYERIVGPYSVYVKFRCAACQTVGERFLSRQEWEQGLYLAAPLGMHFIRTVKPKSNAEGSKAHAVNRVAEREDGHR